MLLSEHFSLGEMLRSETATRLGIPNEPTTAHVLHLGHLCGAVLEPLRAAKGPIRIVSGLRLPALNVAIGGSKTSAHVDGRAADVVPGGPGVTVRDLARWLADHIAELPIDQLIYEGTWCHVGMADKPRRQKLQMFGGKYSPLDFSDPRVT